MQNGTETLPTSAGQMPLKSVSIFHEKMRQEIMDWKIHS